MKMMILALVALLVLGGGGAGAYFYFMKPAEAAAIDGAKATGEDHEKAAKEEHGAKKGGAHGEKPEYVELDPLVLPIINADGITQTISLVVSIEVANAEGSQAVKDLIPRLKDAYIQDMYGMLSDHAALKGGVLQVSMIKERLNKISHEVLGDDVVEDVLLQVVQQRPI